MGAVPKDLIWGVGPENARGMIIGEAPGGMEEIQRVPFVGLSGKLLNEAISAAGGKRSDFYVTNCYKLRPPFNRTPTYEELEEHREYLDQELNEIKPRFLLTLGRTAFEFMTGIDNIGMGKARGLWVDDLLPTWHPSYVLRQGGRDSFAGAEFFADVAEFVKACQ